MVDYLIFGGVKSSDYGIYISGEALFDAPKRDVEAVTVPGRNGEIMLDKGRWENITVTYPAFTYSPTYASFISSIATFRNAIASKVGYQRLEDTFNTGEYRMGAFVDGVDINPIMYNSGATFNLVFNCKPQRFLTSGETEQTVASGGTLTNPTQYDANPLLKVNGYGNIRFNGANIDLRYVEQGDITLVTSGRATSKVSLDLNGDLFNAGDSMTLGEVVYGFGFRNTAVPQSYVFDSYTVTAHTGDSSIEIKANGGGAASIEITAIEQTTTAKQTAVSNQIHYELSLTFKHPVNASTMTVSTTIDIYNNYFPALDQIKYEIAAATLQRTALSGFSIQYGAITAVSSALALGNPTYIDCDLGEAYMIQNDEYISLNRYIDLGSDLPVLKPGSNTVTFDNTFTSVKVVPRWWQL